MYSFPLEPTVHAAEGFVALDDAKVLRNAMKGDGANKDTITQLLTKRSNAQRQMILNTFNYEFKRDLIKDLKSELGGKFENLILALMTPPDIYLATELHDAMAGPGTKESVLNEILCSMSNAGLKSLEEAYHKKYKKMLDSVVKSETSGHYKSLMTLILLGSREEGRVEPLKAKSMAEKLYAAGEKKVGTEEKRFVIMLTHASFEQIKLVADEYQKSFGNSLEKAIKREFSGDIRNSTLAIVKHAENRCLYFAELLDRSVRGLGTKDRALIRLIVSRSEVDLEGIKREYEIMYKRTLYNAVQEDTSGDYKDALLSLIGQ